MTPEIEAHTTVIRELGIFGLKTLVTLNGGAVVVLLAFLGNLADSDSSTFAVSLLQFQRAIAAFLVGISLSMLSVFLTYVLAQLALGYSYTVGENDAQPPIYLRPAIYLTLMVSPAVVGFAAFITGSVFAVAAFSL